MQHNMGVLAPNNHQEPRPAEKFSGEEHLLRTDTCSAGRIDY
jgi:hypothetical protein